MMQHRLRAYVEVSQVISLVYSVKKDLAGKDGAARRYPLAYENYEAARTWMNDFVKLFDRHRFLLDGGTYNALENLNRFILNTHLQVASNDNELKELGNRDMAKVQGLVNDANTAMRGFLNEKYGLDLEEAKVG
jgi:hypothetical protein